MVVSRWRVFTETSDSEAARLLISRLQESANCEFLSVAINDYHKGGHVATFDVGHDVRSWQAAVYAIITCAQMMGRSCSVAGLIEEEIDLVIADTTISGVELVTCQCFRPSDLGGNQEDD